jgi:hypothetical protein
VLQANELRRQLTPDGRRLVLSVGEAVAGGVRYRLALIDLTQGTVAQVVRDDADLIRPAISPDGSKIAYVRRAPTASESVLIDDGLWIVNADGSGVRRVQAGNAGVFTWIFGWTPDSKAVVFDELEWSATPTVVDISSGERSHYQGFVPRMWLSLGNDFAFRAGRTPSAAAGLTSKPFEGEYRLVVADRAGGSQRELVAEGNPFFLLGTPRWNPTSDDILYRHLMNAFQAEFFVASLTGAHARVPLAIRPYLADWTPDGARIVYLSQGFAQGGSLGIAVRMANRDGSGDRELLSLPDGGLSDLVTVRYR